MKQFLRITEIRKHTIKKIVWLILAILSLPGCTSCDRGPKVYTKDPLNIPKSSAYIVSLYEIGTGQKGTYLSTDYGRSFTSVDSLNTNTGVTAFFSKYHGFGASFNANETTMPDKTNHIYKFNPEILFHKKLLN